MRGIASRIKALETNIKKKIISERFKQVMAFYNQACIGNSYQINLIKITMPVELIDLAWILAICSLRTLNFKSTALIALKINIYMELMSMVNKLPLESKIKHTLVKEVELHNINSYHEIPSYILSPEVIISLLSSKPDFISMCLNTEMKNTDKKLKEPKETNFNLPVLNTRPSAKTIPKCEFIVNELEQIAMSFNTAINREILWSQLKQRCKDNNSRFNLGGKRENYIIEKATGNSWDKEGLKYHMKNVIKWHKVNYPHLYSK
ncbi:TPA: hypothetical protein JBK40_02370 [Legionella pneumophila]|uniref:hypothetical protein n=1 Tax=Legionella pneumophila TaxID=446 RepID=UPI00048D6B7D|nr:hypothetical protein [Legionella pneumophila]AOW57610.1 hypothetical protein BE843_04730 [Legionella pneumophila subsp. pneumophila]AOW62209.1 hypothetical protein BE844_14055 [Legionella pneumophila subsp. pneumophila]AOW67608.1 hypothetical protein BE846_11810 [Legionella pneumophila subsp. pneumophila]HAT2046433.1 hypothetical protein [Legionella pneumophila]HAT4006304.1 hypothetical protein [Legionella pneumophila]